MVLVGFSFLAYCNSFLFIRVFRDYEEEDPEEESTDTGQPEEITGRTAVHLTETPQAKP